jgi:protein involved in polysaccharide export with SLBB domain
MRDIERLSNGQLDNIKQELQSQKNEVTEQVSDIATSLEAVSITSENNISKSQNLFGYSYFKRDINFFDNIPTPSEFKLGPGDEIILSLWGETNLRKKFILNREGSIFYENIGFISLNNKTLEEAESVLLTRLSDIYSTINNAQNSTKLLLELGKLKSINIYFSGEIDNPGINLIHPFSDIFTALNQGGIKKTGSLRNIHLIRDGQVVAKFDFYTFFINGKNDFSSIRLLDGDIVHVPVISTRVEVKGEVVRQGFYELIDSDSLSELIEYAGGLKAVAASKIIINDILPAGQRTSDDNARLSRSIDMSSISNTNLNNGASINILSISNNETDVTIYGRVKFPNNYPAANMKLIDVLILAGGFDDPLYRKTIRDDEIIILRKDSKNFYSKEFVQTYNSSATFELEPGDKIFVYENINYENSFTYRVEGEVNKPGTFPLNQKFITLEDALSIAGGLTELSTARNISVKQEYTSTDSDGNETTTTEVVNNATLDFEIGSNSVVTAAPFENVVRVQGNIYNPGLITYIKGAKLPRYIELAGGHKPNSIRNKVYIKRANGNIEQNGRIFLGLGKNIYPGDTIIVPVNPNPSEFNIGNFTTDILSILTNLVAILAIIDNTSD